MCTYERAARTHFAAGNISPLCHEARAAPYVLQGRTSSTVDAVFGFHHVRVISGISRPTVPMPFAAAQLHVPLYT